MKTFLLFCLMLNMSFAQTLGNPGGGGPDGEPPEKLCLSLQKSIERSEEKFLSYWQIKNVGPSSHLDYLAQVEINLLSSFLGNLNIIDQLQVGHCPNVKDRPPFNRENYVQELSLLDEMIGDLEEKKSLQGCVFFTEETRQLHLDRLNAIRKFYGKQ